MKTIPCNDLIVGAHYFGVGRFINAVALWDGRYFHGLQYKWGQYSATMAEYGDSGFSPVVRMEIPEELK